MVRLRRIVGIHIHASFAPQEGKGPSGVEFTLTGIGLQLLEVKKAALESTMYGRQPATFDSLAPYLVQIGGFSDAPITDDVQNPARRCPCRVPHLNRAHRKELAEATVERSIGKPR